MVLCPGLRCGGEKLYAAPRDAVRYARAFDRRDADTLGRRAPLFGLFPLGIWRWTRQRRGHRQERAGSG